MVIQGSMLRLRKELFNIEREPPSLITARPLPSCILKWYFVIDGPQSTPYAGGCYMGKLVFPEDYPFKPPAVYMLTPNGRFRTNAKLCLSISDFHPETWNPLWSVSAILTGLLSFMLGSELTVGSINSSDAEKRSLAQASHKFNSRDSVFRELFADFLTEGEGGAGGEHRTPAASARQSAAGTDVAVARASAAAPGANADAGGVDRTASNAAKSADTAQRESLPSLLMWLFIFLALTAGAWKLFHCFALSS